MRIGYTIAGRTWMYTHVVRALAGPGAAAFGAQPVGPAGAARHRRLRPGARTGGDGAMTRRARDAWSSGSRRRHRSRRSARGHPRQRRQPVPAVAGDSFADARRGAGPRDTRIAASSLSAGPSDARRPRGRHQAARGPRSAPRRRDHRRRLRPGRAARAGRPRGGVHWGRQRAAARRGDDARRRSSSCSDRRCRSGRCRGASPRWFAEWSSGPLPCRPCHQRQCVPGDFRCLTRHQRRSAWLPQRAP